MNEKPIGHCPISDSQDHQHVTLAHGDGGRLSRQLIEKHITPWLYQYSVSDHSDCRTDAAILYSDGRKIAFSSDSYVVSPLFFPGGDIGKLAVCGTCNDLSVVGAEPKWLSLSLIIEEGLSLGILERVMLSIARTAREANITIVTGDTKVVPKGCADGLFINTSGIGLVVQDSFSGGSMLSPGNKILVTGSIAQHGLSILTSREDFGIACEMESDCGLLWPAVKALLDSGVSVRAMRDATRGGVAAVLHEWSRDCGHSMIIEQSLVPITLQARGIVELLGLDPLFIANEGTMLLALDEQDCEKAIKILSNVPISRGTVLLGEVRERLSVPVAVERSLGRLVPLDELSHSLLPRIC